MATNRPVAFQGTDEERRRNRATHHFHTYRFGEDDFETECIDCFCAPWHTAADYPCGQEPERETVEDDTAAAAEQFLRFSAYAAGAEIARGLDA